jgi:hypothetical protein
LYADLDVYVVINPNVPKPYKPGDYKFQIVCTNPGLGIPPINITIKLSEDGVEKLTRRQILTSNSFSNVNWVSGQVRPESTLFGDPNSGELTAKTIIVEPIDFIWDVKGFKVSSGTIATIVSDQLKADYSNELFECNEANTDLDLTDSEDFEINLNFALKTNRLPENAAALLLDTELTAQLCGTIPSRTCNGTPSPQELIVVFNPPQAIRYEGDTIPINPPAPPSLPTFQPPSPIAPIGPIIIADPIALVFENTSVGTVRKQTFRLINIGDETATITGMYSTSIIESFYFGFNRSYPFQLLPDQAITGEAIFAPPTADIFSDLAQVTIALGGEDVVACELPVLGEGGGDPGEAKFKGIALRGDTNLTSDLNFGDTEITEPKSGYIRIYNTGNDPAGLTISESIVIGPEGYYQSTDPEFDKVGLLVSFDGASGSTTFSDESLLGNTLTPLGGAAVSANPKFGSGNLVTNGTQTLKLSNRFQFAMDDFTVECWVKPGVQLDGGYNTVIGSYSNNFTSTGDWSLRTRISGSNQLGFTIRNASNWTDIETGVDLNDTLWHHIAITREGSTLRIYSDGILRGTATSSTTFNDIYDIVIGGNNNTYEFEKNYVGAIDELRITRGLARYTGGTYTVPTNPFPGQQPVNVEYQTNFEDPNKTSFATGIVNINGIIWTLSDAVIAANASGDLKNGAKSIRLRDGSVDTNTPFLNGLSSFKFLAARSNFSGDRTGVSPTVDVQYSTNNGATWTTIGTINFAGVDTLTEYSYTVNTTTATRLRIIKVAGDSGKRINIDDFVVYKCPGCPGSELTPFSTLALNNPITIPIAQTIDVQIVYNPQNEADHTCVYRVTSDADLGVDDPFDGYTYADVYGTGVPLSPTRTLEVIGSSSFGEAVAGRTKDSVITLKNDGNSSLLLGNILSQDPFSLNLESLGLGIIDPSIFEQDVINGVVVPRVYVYDFPIAYELLGNESTSPEIIVTFSPPSVDTYSGKLFFTVLDTTPLTFGDEEWIATGFGVFPPSPPPEPQPEPEPDPEPGPDPGVDPPPNPLSPTCIERECEIPYIYDYSANEDNLT